MQKYLWLFFGWRGRIDRTVYALAGLVAILVQSAVIWPHMADFVQRLNLGGDDVFFGPMGLFENLVVLAGQLSLIFLSAKRLHDFNAPGIFSLLTLFFGIFIFIVLCIVPGTRGANRYAASTNSAS